ncbi:MAG: phosphate signaling complex protein PhoU [Sumerlaeia bacterium]
MSTHLFREMQYLRKQILSQGTLVEEAIRKSIRSFHDTNAELGREVIEGDNDIDRAEIEIEEECLKILALHQPVASDLRFIVCCLKMNNDMERMGDLAVSIARRAVYLSKRPPVARPEEFHAMGEAVMNMVKHSMDALINADDHLAEEICRADDEVDAMKRRIQNEVRATIELDPVQTRVYLKILSVPRHLERIADLATNIAEDVIYLTRGDIARHRNLVEAAITDATEESHH